MHVEHFMTKDPVACDVDASVGEVAGLMRDKGVGSVVVLQGGKVAGIVTDRQLVCNVLADGGDADGSIRDVMTPDPATLTLDDNLFSAIDTMRSAGVVRRVPVVNAEKELLGVVSIADIAVIAKDLVDAVLLEETHHALRETRMLTGAKRLVDVMRRPTKGDLLPPGQETRAVLTPTPSGADRSGGARQPSGTRAEGQARPQEEERGRESRERRGGLLGGLLGG
jgi:CBS domain-containing protein